MELSRRRFLAASATAAALALIPTARAANLRANRLTDEPDELDDANVQPAAKKLKLLILGGTGFTGPHLVRRALKRGHSVTLFNRGRTEKRIGMLPDTIERLIGDRDPKQGEGLKALLDNREWDAVVDTSGQFPRHVKASCEAVQKTKLYLYVSSISAYALPLKADSDEEAPLATLSDPNTEDMGRQMENYGGLKAACEKTAQTALPGRVAVVRPTFISGPGDPTDRFTYWPIRISQGGEVLVPGNPDDLVQFIDSRDLAAFYLTLCENATPGIFNGSGPNPKLSMGALVAACKKVSKSDAKLTQVDEDTLGLLGPSAGAFPIWVPPSGDYVGMGSTSFARSVKAGLRHRTPEQTIKDTLEWFPKELDRRRRVTKELMEEAEKNGTPKPKLGDPEKLRAGPSREDEARMLEAVKAQRAEPAEKPAEPAKKE